MSRESKIIVKDEQEYVDIDGHEFGLGLQLPPVRTMAFPSLATFQPSLKMDEIREITSRSVFEFGRAMFDSSWITNQNGFGSCAAYAGKSALERARFLGGQSRQELSGDYLYSLVNGGRDRGSMLDDVMHAIMQRGVALASTVPLGGIYRNKYDAAKADREALRFRGHELYAVPDEQSLATALALKMTVVIAIHVTNDWRKFDVDDILSNRNNGPGNHSELLDDIKWSEKHGRFLYRKATSHGVNYSDDGFCWVYWDAHLKTPSRYHQFYAVPSATQDPQADNPEGSAVDDLTPMVKPVLVVKKSDSCVWCTRWMDSEYAKCKEAGIEVQSGNFQSSGIPAFNLRVGEKEYRRDGFWKFEDIARKVAELR